MAEVIRMPLMSDTMTEGTLVEWSIKVGDAVNPGDVLAEIETDKATMELESYQSGTVLHLGVEAGQTVPVDAIIAILGDKGEDVSAILAGESKQATAPSTQEQAPTPKEEPVVEASTPVTPAPVQTAPVNPTPIANESERIIASPLAKKMAAQNQLDLSEITGTGGKNGRIVKRDIEKRLSEGSPAPSVSRSQTAVTSGESYEDVPNSQMRKVIARRLGESKFSAPHFYLKMEIEMDAVMQARQKLNELSPVKISFNDIVVKAVAIALRSHPQVNSSWMGDFIRYNKHINIGVAVAVDEGLLVPVIRAADNKGLSQIASEIRELAGKARDRKLHPDEMSGNTFTISNLGMMDIDDFTAIINPPDACIMAVGKIAQVPRFTKKGKVYPVHAMKVTLSCDHRVVDGAVGAKFLQTFKGILEEPMRLLI